MRRWVAELLALAAAVCFFGGPSLILADLDAILPALELFVSGLLLGSLSVLVSTSVSKEM